MSDTFQKVTEEQMNEESVGGMNSQLFFTAAKELANYTYPDSSPAFLMYLNAFKRLGSMVGVQHILRILLRAAGGNVKGQRAPRGGRGWTFRDKEGGGGRA